MSTDAVSRQKATMLSGAAVRSDDCVVLVKCDHAVIVTVRDLCVLNRLHGELQRMARDRAQRRREAMVRVVQ